MDIFGLIKWLLKKIIYDVAKALFVRYILKPESPLYYKKLWKVVKGAWFIAKVWSLITLIRFLTSIGISKPSKDLETKIAVVFAFAIIAAAIILVAKTEQEKKNLTT